MASEWTMAICIFIIILAIAIGGGWYYKYRTHPKASPPSAYAEPMVWVNVMAGPDPLRNTCQVYQFPATMAADNTVAIGTPTFNTQILNASTGMTIGPYTCIDADQLVAQQMQRTCSAPEGSATGSVSKCVLMNGQLANIGDVELYYSDEKCIQIPDCTGELSLVSLNFHGSTTSPIGCLSAFDSELIPMINICDPSDPSQLFRITRISPGENPATVTPSQESSGIIAQILHRESGLCIGPATFTETPYNYCYNYVEAVNSACTAGCASFQTQETPLSLSECTGGIYPGYNWLLLPSIDVCALTGGTGCDGCTGHKDCYAGYRSNACFGNTACTGYATFPTPQQIVYIGDLDIASAPTGNASELVMWLVQNGAKSMFPTYYNPSVGNNLGAPFLIDMGLDVGFSETQQSCWDISYTAQYLNILAYNNLVEERVCIADGTFGTANCTF